MEGCPHGRSRTLDKLVRASEVLCVCEIVELLGIWSLQVREGGWAAEQVAGGGKGENKSGRPEPSWRVRSQAGELGERSLGKRSRRAKERTSEQYHYLSSMSLSWLIRNDGGSHLGASAYPHPVGIETK